MTTEQLQTQTYTPPTEFTFNFPRLVKEVDDLVNYSTEQSTLALKEAVSILEAKAKSDLNTLLYRNKEEFSNHYQQEVQKAFGDIKQDLIEEIARGRTQIIIPSGGSFTISHEDHPQFENIIEDLVTYKKILLVGRAGTGKTYMAEQFAEKLSLPFYKYSASRDSSVHDLLGYKQPRSEEYLQTVFLNAYENGGVFLVDEYDSMSSDMALFFNGVADNSKSISVPHRDSNPIAKKHENFYLIFCGNTWGTGSLDYTGRDFQDLALLDRFRFSRHEVYYHTPLEQKLCNTISKNLYSDIVALRQELESRNSYLSTRNVEDLVRFLQIKLKDKIEALDLEVTPGGLSKSVYSPHYNSAVHRLVHDIEEIEKEALLRKLNITPNTANTDNVLDGSELPF